MQGRYPSRHLLRRAIAIAGICAGTALLALVVLQVIRLEAGISRIAAIKDQIITQNEVFRTLIQLTGGIVILTGLYFSARTLHVSKEGQITERFNKAVDHMGATNGSLRLGGIYALARIAADSVKDAPTVVEILSLYVKEATTGADLDASTPADVTVALKILGSAPWIGETQVDLTGCRFRGIIAKGLQFRRSMLNGASFRDCELIGTVFDGSSLVGADFQRSFLQGSSFQACDATTANFEGASLRRADFRAANIFGASFDAAVLLKANFKDAGAAITQQFDQAIWDDSTILPLFAAVERSRATPEAP